MSRKLDWKKPVRSRNLDKNSFKRDATEYNCDADMRKLIAVTLISTLSVSALAGIIILGLVSNTSVDNTIASDTTWSKANSPHVLSEPVSIGIGKNLTVEPGVIIDLKGNSLHVNGTLIIHGNTNEKVWFNNGSITLNSNGQMGFDSIIENAVLSNSTEIVIDSGSPSISNNAISGSFHVNGGHPLITNNSIDTRIIVKGGAPIISNNAISDGVHVDARGGPVTIANNTIWSKSGFKVIYVQGIHADISGNRIVGNEEMGIYAWLMITSASITDNQISNCTTGIRAEAGAKASDMRILRNVVFNNELGIDSFSLSDIRDNTIAQNSIGIRYSGLTISNNIYENSKYNFETNWPPDDIDVTNNWWGTTNIQLINQTIFDKKNDPLISRVNFVPILYAPNPKAPAIPVKLTPLPAMPETNETFESSSDFLPLSPVIADTFVVALVTCVGVFIYLKKRKTKITFIGQKVDVGCVLRCLLCERCLNCYGCFSSSH